MSQIVEMGGLGASVGAIGERFLAMGMRHAAGNDGSIDLVSAHMCFNLAHREGIDEAAQLRQETAGQMSKAEIAAALKAARDWITGAR